MEGQVAEGTKPGSIAAGLPRVAITYCTKCKWLLRAAYFGQELLSTFETKIGEVALLPTVGGIFEVRLTYKNPDGVQVEELIWDFASKRSFPETKILKQLIRNHIDPNRSLGHSDKPSHSDRALDDTTSDSNKESKQILDQASLSGSTVTDNKDCTECA